MKSKNKDFLVGYSYDEWIAMEKQFKKDYENSTTYNKSFRQLINEILEGENYLSFQCKTGFSPNMFYRLKNYIDEKQPPKKATIMTICVGYDLDLMMAQSILHSLGVDFNRFNKADYAYTFLLTRCRGKNYSECNEILKKLGISKGYWLGATERTKSE